MKSKIIFCTMVLLVSAFTGSAFGGNETGTNTWYGQYAGNAGGGSNNSYFGQYAGFNNMSNSNTFLGYYAGTYNTTGSSNTFIGSDAGHSNTTGSYNTFLGLYAGYSNITGNFNTYLGNYAGYSNTAGYQNTLLGYGAGYFNTTGYSNTFLGLYAGYHNTTGSQNNFLGMEAGYSNTTGYGNVFLGHSAGSNETGSNKLYIDNSNTPIPLIYGEFDNRILTINGNLEVIGPYQGLVYLSNTTANNTTKVSRMVLNHYSDSELPVYLFGAASTATNNFVAFGGGNTIGNAATQIDLFTAENPTTPVGTARITIKGNGYVGIGTQTPSYPLHMAGGAYTNGSIWVDASSREYKENIEILSTEEALEAIKELNPVKYAYKTDQTEKRVGFIAEEVPELVSMKDRKGLSPMDIVAVLTKVVQEQRKEIEGQKKDYQKTISMLSERMDELERALQLKGTLAPVK